jgi:hypothetical protein
MNELIGLNFKYIILEELPGGGEPLIYIPHGNPGVGRDGLIVRFFPQSSTDWTGVFAFGDMLPNGECGVFEGPGKNHLTVLAKGEAYIVAADNPKSFEQVNCCPVVAVVLVPSHNMVLFHDFTDIAAYNETGLLWQTGRISWDGIEIVSIKNEQILGLAWDAPNEKHVEFKVDLASGTHEGGAYPP